VKPRGDSPHLDPEPVCCSPNPSAASRPGPAREVARGDPNQPAAREQLRQAVAERVPSGPVPMGPPERRPWCASSFRSPRLARATPEIWWSPRPRRPSAGRHHRARWQSITW